MRSRTVTLEELKSCPKRILSADHWTPIHKVEECNADKIKESKPMKSMYQDIQKQCVECGSNFDWSIGEQKFVNRLHEEGKIQSIVEPKRCADCRKKKRERFERHDSPQVHLP